MLLLIMVVGWLRGVGFVGLFVKILFKRLFKFVDVGRLFCGDDIDEGFGVFEYVISVGVEGILLVGVECLRMVSVSLL